MQILQFQVERHPNESHILSIHSTVPTLGSTQTKIQFAFWRPGRYQHANYMKNITGITFKNLQGEPLNYKKTSREGFEVDTKGIKEFKVEYLYHADELNAGSTWCDINQIYINPVNCIFYLPDEPNLPYSILIKTPKSYHFATSLKKDGQFIKANNHQELFDSPVIASENAIIETFEVSGTKFHLFIVGSEKVNTKKIITDFEAYTTAQIEAFGSIPTKEFWYLIQVKPETFYHGVEHQNSTVIALGPTKTLTTPDGYQKLLEVCSHELYHVWNIKYIRPIEMYPYDYSKENYSVCNYIAEGVTTYMGDQMLLRGGVLSQNWFNHDLTEKINAHIKARFHTNISLADAAFDTWVDGYEKRKAGRDVNIYREGGLFFFLLDAHIINFSNRKNSLDCVMKKLYEKALKNKAYSENDFIAFCQQFGGDDVLDFFKKYVHGTESIINALVKTLPKIGLKLSARKSYTDIKEMLGYETDKSDKVLAVSDGGEAKKAGLKPGDRLISVNGKDNVSVKEIETENNHQFITLLVNRDKTLVNLKIDASNFVGLQFYDLEVESNLDEETLKNYQFWKNRK
jgi:predicted metalloprotease with PDZ domain